MPLSILQRWKSRCSSILWLFWSAKVREAPVQPRQEVVDMALISETGPKATKRCTDDCMHAMLHIDHHVGITSFGTEPHLDTNLPDDADFLDDIGFLFDSDFEYRCSHCDQCSKNMYQKSVWPQVIPLRDGDESVMRVDVLKFMMRFRLRNRFSLLDLPVEVRLAILRHLLYHHRPLISSHAYGPDFVLHPQILGACRQLYDEGSLILKQQNTFILAVSNDGVRGDSSQLSWIYDKLSIDDPTWGTMRNFHMINKLVVVIHICGADDPGDVESDAEDRSLLYELVDLIQSRPRMLSRLSIWYDYEGWSHQKRDQKPVQVYQPDDQSSDPSTNLEALTLEEYNLEPLANLKGTARELIFEGMTMRGMDFLESRMRSLENFTLGRRVKTDCGVYLN